MKFSGFVQGQRAAVYPLSAALALPAAAARAAEGGSRALAGRGPAVGVDLGEPWKRDRRSDLKEQRFAIRFLHVHGRMRVDFLDSIRRPPPTQRTKMRDSSCSHACSASCCARRHSSLLLHSTLLPRRRDARHRPLPPTVSAAVASARAATVFAAATTPPVASSVRGGPICT